VRLLLDTHSMYWYIEDDPQLSGRARTFLPTHTARLIGLPFPQGHRDPFDRLLVAQVLVEQIPIVSADSPLDAYGVTRLW
jgi:PIN domain nuclease of toxin-antitoxin system